MFVNTGLIIFARMGSSRLPGKMLMPLGGRPLLGRVIDRTRRVSGNHPIVVATSDLADDDPIAGFADREGVAVFRGSLDDVAGRALACCEAYGFDRFARICGDRPFLPWELIDELLIMHVTQNLDLATNALEKTYPAGTMTEIVSTAALRCVLAAAGADVEDREHVTRHFYRFPSEFRIGNRASGWLEWARLSMTIDRADDVTRAEWIFSMLGKEPEAASLEQVAALAAEWERGH